MGTGCADPPRTFLVQKKREISQNNAYFNGFWSFLEAVFVGKKKCAGVPEAFWGWFEVVASGQGACAHSAPFVALKIARNISK